jgi:hypothetical protein
VTRDAGEGVAARVGVCSGRPPRDSDVRRERFESGRATRPSGPGRQQGPHRHPRSEQGALNLREPRDQGQLENPCLSQHIMPMFPVDNAHDPGGFGRPDPGAGAPSSVATPGLLPSIVIHKNGLATTREAFQSRFPEDRVSHGPSERNNPDRRRSGRPSIGPIRYRESPARLGTPPADSTPARASRPGPEWHIRRGREGRRAGRPGRAKPARIDEEWPGHTVTTGPSATTEENRVKVTNHPRIVNRTPPADPVKTRDSVPIWRYPGGNSRLQ